MAETSATAPTPAPTPRFVAAGALVALISRYGLAGVVNTAVGYAVIAGLDVGLHVSPQLANAAGFLVGMGVGFVLNRKFVFKYHSRGRATALRYSLVFLAAFALNQGILHAVGAALGAGRLSHLFAQLCGMAAYTLAMFPACRFWVFRAAG